VANYALEIIYPRAQGTAGSGLNVNNRCYRAYTGLTYEIRASAIGGDFPYTWSLSNAPSGMSINSETGLITWTNPTSNASNVVVSVEDSSGSTDSETWSITVGTSGFKFIDAVNGSDSNGGTLAAPYQTLAHGVVAAAATDIVYFRTGTYTWDTLDVDSPGNASQRTDINDADGEATIWLAYPGESPVLDQQYAGTGFASHIRFSSPYIYVDGFEMINIWTFGFSANRKSNYGAVFRNCTFDGTDMDGAGSGSNAAMIEFFGKDQDCQGSIIQDCVFHDIDDANTVKLYGTIKCLVEDCTHTDINTAAIEPKESNRQYTIRGNTFLRVGNEAVGGDMASDDSSSKHYGEICFNNIISAGTNGTAEHDAIAIQRGENLGPTHVYRNTIQGRIFIDDIGTEDGPIDIRTNVLVNNDNNGSPWPYINDGTQITDTGRITVTNNLTRTIAANDVVSTTTGLLIDPYRTSEYLGVYGHEAVRASHVSRKRYRAMRLRAA